MTQNRQVRSRGFNQFRKNVRDKQYIAKSVANCKSCRYLDDEGVCGNPSVSKFDLIEEEHKTYCNFWKGFEYDNGRRKKDPFDW